ncbi:xanthine dehydrogenase family protein molybdopterin-binding subunit [Paracoccus sp. AK26]|uniref:xanthine dehydrogenase family protein molybdopterin-binding subunit n=1 Tax=Paracoccus sp. AK26 TaxID=2589076 RepID=UPI0014283D2D|nr:xanthine dehydrogenase family protein molybdopterin-binding subunit [Paracoccus sp. AK26]QIR86980.1 xanthine dehydrogenase family protein molybdopterin-binding subunit [Paracoccus sp. AK26]
MAVLENLSRRAVLLGMGAGALVLAVNLPARAQDAPEEPLKFGADAMPHGWKDDPNIFVAIDPDGTVTVTVHRSEMGQGVRTSIAMAVADELEADWARVKVAQAPGDEPTYGNQDTDGSRSLRHFFDPMRRAGAAARQMLREAAAAEWGVPVEEVTAENHILRHAASGREAGYGDMATRAAEGPVPAREGLVLKSPDQFRYIGRDDIGLIDNPDIVTGATTYGMDAKAEGMLFAVIARPPVVGGRVASHDDTEALKVPGVQRVVVIDAPPQPSEFQPLGGVAVIATNTWAAMRGREALSIEWEDGPHAAYDSEAFRAELEQAARSTDGVAVRNQGDALAALQEATRTFEAEYYIPHLAQAPMEPPAALAMIRDGRCDVWACVQAPQVTRVRVAEKLGLDPQNVTVNVTLLGGGFGRKSKPDFVVEAAVLSREMDGAPVKVVWTREDDLHHSYFHTVSAEHLKAGLDDNGRPTAWLHRTAAPTIGSIFAPDPKQKLPFELGMGLTNMPLDIPNVRAENPQAQAHTRIGWYRSVSNIPHAFAIQSFIAELAHEAGRDHRDYLLEVIGPARRIDPTEQGDVWNYGEDPARYPIDTGRLRRVIEAATDAAGWGREMPEGSGLGLAAHYSFVTYVAVVAETEVSDGNVLIPRVHIAVDCGPHVNPDRIRSQMEGAVIMGVGQALMSRITFANGRAQQDNFDSYLVPRMDSSPREIHVHLVGGGDYGQPLGGVGEPGLPPVTPAITNAIFAATGKRIRALPVADQLRS